MSRVRLLHVDDDSDILELVTYSIRLDPLFEVRCAASGAAALACLGAFTPDVILLDVMMPSMDGRQTLEAIRQLPEHVATPVIFLTARAFREDNARLIALGAKGVITKPFDPMTLARDIRKILAD